MEKDITEINSRRRVLAPHPHAFTAAMTIYLYKCLIKSAFTMRTLNCRAQPGRTIPSPLSLHADRTLDNAPVLAESLSKHTILKRHDTQPLECQRVLNLLKLPLDQAVESRFSLNRRFQMIISRVSRGLSRVYPISFAVCRMQEGAGLTDLLRCLAANSTNQVDLTLEDNILICDSLHSGRTFRAGKEAAAIAAGFSSPRQLLLCTAGPLPT